MLDGTFEQTTIFKELGIMSESCERELSITIGDLVRPFVVAILALPLDCRSPNNIICGGSGGFIDTGSTRLLITAKHVADLLHNPGTSLVLAAGDKCSPLPLDGFEIIDANEDLDIATLSVPSSFTPSQIDRQYLKLASWPPPRATSGESAFFVGYPGIHREATVNSLDLSLTVFCDGISSVSDRHFVMADETGERLPVTLEQGLPPFGPTGGISGCLVFIERQGIVIPTGVLYEGGDGHDTTFFAAHLDFVKSDGKINRSAMPW